MWRLKRPFWFYYKRLLIVSALYWGVFLLTPIFKYGLWVIPYFLIYGSLWVIGITLIIALSLGLLSRLNHVIKLTPIKLFSVGFIFHFLISFVCLSFVYSSLSFWELPHFRQKYLYLELSWEDINIYMFSLIVWIYGIFLLIQSECPK